MKEKPILAAFKPEMELFLILLIFAIGVLINFIADSFGRGSLLFYLFYQGIFALGICIFIPMVYTVVYKKEELSSIGISSKKWLKVILIGLIIAAISVAGSLFHKNIIIPSSDKLLYLLSCLVMSTLFEEVFFRGFLQTKFEKYFGMIPAIIFAGICFALYHIGYSDMRDIHTLIVLAAVGIVFSISFRITRNIITSYIVNLPNAVITFLDRKTYFDSTSAIISLITAIIGLILILYFCSRNKKSVSHL